MTDIDQTSDIRIGLLESGGIILFMLLLGFSVGNPRYNWADFLFFPTTIFITVRFWREIKSFLGEYGRYFSISILYILLMGGILTTVGQIDNMVVELFDLSAPNGTRNFWLFVLLQFPFSLVLVWYMPNYLRYTDTQLRKDKEEKKSRSYLEIFSMRLNESGAKANEETDRKVESEKPQNLSKEETSLSETEGQKTVFHGFRRVLGEVYIFVFIYFLVRILQNSGWQGLAEEQVLLMVFLVLLQYKFMKWVYFYECRFSWKKGILFRRKLKNISNKPVQYVALLLQVLSLAVFAYVLMTGAGYWVWLNAVIFLTFLWGFVRFSQEESAANANNAGNAEHAMLPTATEPVVLPQKKNPEREAKVSTLIGNGLFLLLATFLIFLLFDPVNKGPWIFWLSGVSLFALLYFWWVLTRNWYANHFLKERTEILNLKSFQKVKIIAGEAALLFIGPLTLLFLVSIRLPEIEKFQTVVAIPLVGVWAIVYLLVSQSLKKVPSQALVQKTELSLFPHAVVGMGAMIVFLLSPFLAALCYAEWIHTPWNGMLFFIIALIFFLLAFVFLCDYRRIMRAHTLTQAGLSNLLHHVQRLFVPLLLLSNFFFVLAFLGAWLLGLFGFEQLFDLDAHLLNPINVFFLAINGIFPLIGILERYFALIDLKYEFWFAKSKPKSTVAPESENNQTHFRVKWIAIGIFVFLFVLGYSNLKQGNGYHRIAYQGEYTAWEDSMMTLSEYTEAFLARLERSKTDTIYLVAADGGGLRAAYWTLLVMQKLDAEFQFNDNLFITSGASGGSVGLGMFAYLKGVSLSENFSQDAEAAITAIGAHNFLNTDMIGLLARWPHKMTPERYAEQQSNRMEIMARDYLQVAFDSLTGSKEESNQYHSLAKKPFAYPWIKRNYGFPLFVVNTSRMEDGRMGIIHPLKTNKSLTRGMIDLRYTFKDSQQKGFINYPDALFSTNRFPVISPYAEIEGKGHFFDAGMVENSGIGTILQFLQYMKADTANPHYQSFFGEDKTIMLISIQSAKSRYVYDEFKDYQDKLNQTRHMYYFNALLKAISSGGPTGKPIYYEELMNDFSYRQAYGIHQYHTVNMPAHIDPLAVDDLLSNDDIGDALFGQIEDESLRQEMNALIDALNDKRVKHFSSEGQDTLILEPPLGRMLAKEARNYMRAMNEWKTSELIQEIKSGSPVSGRSIVLGATGTTTK